MKSLKYVQVQSRCASIDKYQISFINFHLMNKESNKYNLQMRTTEFSKEIIKLCKATKSNIVNNTIIDQLVRSGTSIGANYMEAINGSSKKDFKNKIFICKKEAQETKYWLEMLKESDSDQTELINKLSQECHELNLIFQKTINTLVVNMKINT